MKILILNDINENDVKKMMKKMTMKEI